MIKVVRQVAACIQAGCPWFNVKPYDMHYHLEKEVLLEQTKAVNLPVDGTELIPERKDK